MSNILQLWLLSTCSSQNCVLCSSYFENGCPFNKVDYPDIAIERDKFVGYVNDELLKTTNNTITKEEFIKLLEDYSE